MHDSCAQSPVRSVDIPPHPLNHRGGMLLGAGMAGGHNDIDDVFDGLDQSKRETLARLIRGSAFVAPVVASFAMQGLAVRPAEAASSTAVSNFSDIRLKRDMTRIGTHPMGFGIYRFKYLWSEADYVGVLAQEVLEKAPHAVVKGPADFLAVNYAALGMAMTRDAACVS